MGNPNNGEMQESTSGAAGTIKLGDREFLVSQATDGMLMTVRKRLKKAAPDPLKMYAEVIRDPRWRVLPKKIRDEIAKEAGMRAAEKSKAVTPEMLADMLMEPEHCRFLAWVLLREYQPELQLAELTELINEDNAAAVFMELQRESGMDALGN